MEIWDMDQKAHIMWKLRNFLTEFVSAHWLKSAGLNQALINGNPVEETENLSLASFAKIFDLNLFPANLSEQQLCPEWMLKLKLDEIAVFVSYDSHL